MALENNDLQLIGVVVDRKIKENNKKLRAEIRNDTQVIVNKEVGQLRLDFNQRMDVMDKKNDEGHKAILGKIDEIKKMKSEDVQALAEDIEMIKKRLPA